MKKFSKKTLHKQLVLASLLSANALAFGSTIFISNGGMWYGSVSVVGDTDHTGFDGASDGVSGIYNPEGPVLYGPGSETYLNLGNGSQVQATGTQSAYGIILRSDGAEFLADELEINIQGGGGAYDMSAGIYLSGASGSANLGSNTKITVDGATTKALYVTNGTSLNADKLTITTSGMGPAIDIRDENTSVDLGSESTINTSGFGAIGVALTNYFGTDNAKFKANKFNISTEGQYASGMQLSRDTTADLGSNSTITTTGDGAEGVLTLGEFKADTFTVRTKGDYATGVVASSDAAKVVIGEDSHIITEKAGGILAQYGSSLDFKGSSAKRNSISAAGGDYAINSTGESIITLEYADVSMNGNGTNSSILQSEGMGVGSEINALNSNFTGATGVSGAIARDSGKINLSGETNLTMATSTETAMKAVSMDSKITGTGKMNITGNVLAEDTGVVDLSMIQGSLLTGKADTSSNTGTINLSLSSSHWEMTEDSNLSKLALNDSTVNFAENKVGSVLKTKELSGSGTFQMQVNMASIVGDKLQVTESSSGNHHINVHNNGAVTTTGTELLTIVETTDGGATFDLTNQVEVGGYVYDLRRKTNNTDWELFSPPTGFSGGDISTTANASASFLNAGYLLNYAETQTLLQRMGELRQAENSQGDAWVRAYTGKLDSFDSGKLSGFDMDYTGVQAGADKRLDVNGEDLYLGAMVGASQADPNYASGDGDLKSYNLGIYGTYVTDNGFYVDGVLKYNHMKNKFNNVLDTQKNLVNGDAKSDGYGVSLEVGKRFYFDQTKSGYYIEPQAQLTYTHQGSVSTSASNGLVTDMDAYDSTIGRISALIGYEVKGGANPMNVYVKTGYVTEMSGDVNYALNGHKENNDFGGSWWDNGIGVTAQINKKHNLYLEGTYSTGNRFYQMQINAGYRYSF